MKGNWYTFIMQSIGIFGGTFDPPHLGHLILAAEARSQFDLEQVLWVVTQLSPLKQDQAITPIQHRLEMVRLALHDAPEFGLSTVDIDRPGPHYSVDTVRILARQNPAAQLTYLMGGDSLRDLPKWHDPLEFVHACHAIGVMRRPGDEVDLPALEQRLPGLTAKVRWMETPLIDISASDIRARAVAGQPFRHYLPAAVYGYIVQNGLYRNN
jgi:nicotinate-nucleotide adenylyltransferase